MIIDVFNHFMPKAIFERLSDLVPGHIALAAFPELPTLWDVDARLRMMDEFDGLQQVLSLANPPIEMLGSPEKTPELARIANDGLALLCRKHPEMGPCQYERNNCRASGGRVFAADGVEITMATEAEYDKKVMRVRFRAN